MTPSHDIRKAYNLNYIGDAYHLYWAARWMELNPSTDEKNRALDAYVINRLRKDADRVLKQAMNGLDFQDKSVAEGMDMMKQLAEGEAKRNDPPKEQTGTNPTNI